jgi:hypothetical protein
VSDLIKADHLLLSPSIPVTAYRDSFGNWCSRIVAPTGQLQLSSDAVVSDDGKPDLVAPWLEQRPRQAAGTAEKIAFRVCSGSHPSK